MGFLLPLHRCPPIRYSTMLGPTQTIHRHPNGEPHVMIYGASSSSSLYRFAFDAEMSYGIYGGRKNTSVFLRTYRTTNTLGPLLYFDGLSAALTFSGTLDSQDLLAPPNSTSGANPFGDYARAERLCGWASTRGVEGFVRTNAGFELLWCNMRFEGLKLVRNMNVTRWADEMNDHSDRSGSDRDGERGGHRRPPVPGGDHLLLPGPGPGRHPPGRGFNMFARYASWEWLRAASHTYDGLGEARVRLDSVWHVTARGTSVSQLGASRMASLPNETIAIWKNEVDAMLRMALEENKPVSGIEWRGLTDAIVARYGDRLPELGALLDRALQVPEDSYALEASAYTHFTNASAPLQHAYRQISSLVLPFYDHEATKESQINICTSSILPDLTTPECKADFMNPFENKLWRAINHVHNSICTILIEVHAELTALRPHWNALESSHKSSIAALHSKIEHLIAQLDWSLWVRCPEVCAWGQVCYVPIWPLVGFGTQSQTLWPDWGDGRPEPQCVSIG